MRSMSSDWHLVNRGGKIGQKSLTCTTPDGRLTLRRSIGWRRGVALGVGHIGSICIWKFGRRRTRIRKCPRESQQRLQSLRKCMKSSLMPIKHILLVDRKGRTRG